MVRYPSKYFIQVRPNGDDIAKCADAVVSSIIEVDDKDAVVSYIKECGNFTIGSYYSDIAKSKQFKLMQVANQMSLFNMTAKIMEE